MDWEFGISRCKLGWMNKVILHSTGNYIQYPRINHNRKEYLFKKEYLYVYYWVTVLHIRDWHNIVNQLYLNLDRGRTGKESACQCRRCRFESCVEKIPWSGAWQPTPVFPPGESHGQRILAGYSLYSCRVGHHLAGMRALLGGHTQLFFNQGEAGWKKGVKRTWWSPTVGPRPLSST